jgi:hypothetical protein
MTILPHTLREAAAMCELLEPPVIVSMLEQSPIAEAENLSHFYITNEIHSLKQMRAYTLLRYRNRRGPLRPRLLLSVDDDSSGIQTSTWMNGKFQ